MKYTIYQIENVENINYAFMPFKFAKQHNFAFHDYAKLYEGHTENLCCKSGYANNELEDIFHEFNGCHPEDFKGHNLSVSDIVVLEDPETRSCQFYYCDHFGWTNVTEYI